MRKYDINKVKYWNQWENKYEPQGTCNFTSVAMALTGYGFVGGGGRFPDELFKRYNHRGSRHNHEFLAHIINDYSQGEVLSYFSYSTNYDVLLQHLKHSPVIVGGDFTPSGHIILLKGIDKDGYIVANDPNGKFSAHTGQYNSYLSGENDLWRAKSLEKWLTQNGSIWAHLITTGK